MSSIVIVLPKIEDGKRIRDILAKRGYEIDAVCSTAAAALGEMNNLNGGIVICGYKLPDMFFTDLNECMPSGFQMLLIASSRALSAVEGTGIMAVTMPLSVYELVNTLEMMLQSAARRRKKERAKPKVRSAEEQHIIWGEKALFFIGAAGIAVRMIAPHVKDKFTDSPVLVMDEKGSYVIPLLSGHVGGAVELAKEIAEKINAQAVLTTATDVEQKFAVDVFAKSNGLVLTDRKKAKEISAVVLDGNKIGLYSVFPVEGNFPEELKLCETEEFLRNYPYGIRIAGRSGERREEKTILDLLPKNLVLGIGCRKGISEEEIQSAVNEAKKILGFTEKEVIEIDSIDLKKEEEGLLSYAAKWKLPFYTFSAEELGKVKCVSSHSEFVRKVTGVDNVCERAAILAAGEDGRLLMPKQCMNRVTIAVAEKKVRIRI